MSLSRAMMPLIQNRQRKISVRIPSLMKFARQVSMDLKLPPGEFMVLLANDRRIRQMNRDFRHKDKATDVLSFPVEPDDGVWEPGAVPYFGDIIISLETAQRQARQRGYGLEKELKILLLHGWLHLLGYDHEIDGGQMRRKERQIQNRLLSWGPGGRRGPWRDGTKGMR
jgi:probable rRNA maturation factor